MTHYGTRRQFLKQAGLSALGVQLAMGLPSLSRADGTSDARKQRLIFVFSPNGVIPQHFWPETLGADFELKKILKPLEPFRDQMITMHGVCNRIKGDGDGFKNRAHATAERATLVLSSSRTTQSTKRDHAANS